MIEKVEEKLDELINILDTNSNIQKELELKNKLMSNKDLLNKIEKLKILDIYSTEYKELKKEIFNNKDFCEYKHLENEINLMILEINKKLNKLTSKKECI